MAIGISFYLIYSSAQIERKGMQDAMLSVRCRIRYTPDALPWSLAKKAGHPIIMFQFMLDVKVKPRLWHDSHVKATHPNSYAINNRIAEVKDRALQLHAEYVKLGKFPNNEDYTLAIMGRQAAKLAPDIFQDYERYIAYSESRRVSRSFIYNQQLTLRRLREYAKSGAKITYEGINKTFSAEFSRWMQEQRPGGRKGATATKHLKLLRMFMNHALLEGWTTSIFFKQIKISERREAFPVTLTYAEIIQLYQLTEADLKHLKPEVRKNVLISRDWFILATQTALRISDWDPKRLKVVQTPAGPNFQFVQAKTIGALEVPISDLAMRILERHGGRMPAPFVPSATLKHVTDLARAAGIHKHITTHTARRTFATLQEKAGVPRSIIMRITGHRTEKDYLKYIGITFEHNADMLRRANPDWFSNSA